MPKPSLQKEVGVLFNPSVGGRDKRVHVFPKGYNPKVSVIAKLEFDLVYYDVAVLHISYYATAYD